LGDFTGDEVRAFLECYREKVSFTEDEMKFINSYLEPRPLKLQILCDFLIRNRERRFARWGPGVDNPKKIHNIFLRRVQAERHRQRIRQILRRRIRSETTQAN